MCVPKKVARPWDEVHCGLERVRLTASETLCTLGPCLLHWRACPWQLCTHMPQALQALQDTTDPPASSHTPCEPPAGYIPGKASLAKPTSSGVRLWDCPSSFLPGVKAAGADRVTRLPLPSSLLAAQGILWVQGPAEERSGEMGDGGFGEWGLSTERGA